MSSAGAARGRGGKFSKPKRGGGKHFSKNLRPLDADGAEIGMWGDQTKKEESSSPEEEDEDSSEESSSEEEAESMTREQRREAAKR
ncbi:hypothetical protein LTR16_006584, partial [Cryomyces antarcticus]